jgi:hypothetical protein
MGLDRTFFDVPAAIASASASSQFALHATVGLNSRLSGCFTTSTTSASFFTNVAFLKILFGVSPNDTGVLASHISLLAKTLLSLTGARPLATGSLLENLALLEFSRVGGGLRVFLEPLVSHHEADLMDPQRDDAFVLEDFREAPEMEDVSDAGEE